MGPVLGVSLTPTPATRSGRDVSIRLALKQSWILGLSGVKYSGKHGASRKDHYYDPAFRKCLDWLAVGKHYHDFLKYVNNRNDLNYVLGT